MRKTQPAAYMKIRALLVPREMKVDHSAGLSAMTDEHLEDALTALREILARGKSARPASAPIDVRNASEIERAIAQFARAGDGGLVVTGSELAALHRDAIVSLAARNRLPTIYSDRYFVAGGGLISYGPDRTDEYRHAAGYVDRILKGEKPADLPVQASTKYQLVINLKTAQALGLTVPPSLLATADEVIE